MKDLIGAIAEEKLYVADRIKQINTSLIERLKTYGYENLQEYFTDKKECFFNEWKPEVYRIDIEHFASAVEEAIISGKYGIYIPVANGIYAYHGTDSIDYGLCENLGVKVVELNYSGGTIVGSAEDLSIEIVIPADIGVSHSEIIQKFTSIIGAYIENVEISGNDILVNGEKVMGSMTRQIGNTFVWAAQVSFAEYSELIAKICNKASVKKPSFIDSKKLTRDKLESEVLEWLR